MNNHICKPSVNLKVMIISIALCLAALAVPIAGQQPSIFPVFILDSDPVSLEASLVAVNPVPTETYQSIVTLQVDCPKSASPENDACRALGVYPAELYHTQGSVYGGTVTAGKPTAATTTTWSCALGGAAYLDLAGTCVRTLVGGAGLTSLQTTVINSCYVVAHSVPLLVTAGADKLDAAYYATWPLASILSAYDSELESMGCPPTTAAAATTTASASISAATAAAGSGSGSSGPASSGTSPTRTQSSTTESISTGASAGPTETPNGASFRGAVMTSGHGMAILMSIYLALQGL